MEFLFLFLHKNMADILEVELQITDGNAEVVIAKNKQLLKDFVSEVEKAQPQIRFTIPNQNYIDLDKLEKRAEETRKSFAEITKVRLDGGQINNLTKEAVKASERSRQLESDIKNIRKELANPNRKSSIEFLTTELRGAEMEADKLDRRLQTLNRRAVSNAPNANAANSTPSAAGGLGDYIVPAAIGAAAVSYGKDALDAAREADSAQRILQASAKETGISYEKLSASAAKFGADTLQSNRAAQSSFAQIVTFANAAGRSDKLEEFRTKFADLAAAKGIDPSNLGEIAKQLNALTDEATDKLLNGNPSAFYDKFAKSINKTAGELSDAEKRAAVFDEVLRRGAIFSGEAQKRLESSASAVDRLSVKFENIKESAGKAVLPLAQFVEFAAKVVTVDSSLYKSGAESAAGRNNQEILSKQKIDETVQTLRSQDKLITDAIANPLKSSLNSELAKISLADSFFNAENRQKLIDAAKTTAQTTADNFKKSFDAVLSDKNSSIDLLKLGQKQFYANQADYDPETRRKLAEGFENSIAEKQKVEAEKTKAALEKRNADLKTATAKAEELGKKYRETFDSLFVSTSKDNPFASIFSESDRAVDRLRENLKGLSPELRGIAEQLQKTNDSNKLFETRIDNSLSVFGLEDEANNFRNPRTDSLVDKDRFEEIIRQNISQGNFFNGNFGSYGSNLSNQAGGFDKLTDTQKRDIFEVSTFSNLQNNPVNPQTGYSGFGANPADYVGFLARQRSSLTDDPNATLQERLQKQIDIVGSSNPKTDDEKSIADRKLIALTAGLDPAKSTDRINDIAASAREREAVRREGSEKDAEKDRKKQIELQTRIAENQEKLLKIAEKEGLKGLDKLLVEVKDSPTTKSTVTRANPSDTAKQMDLSGTYFEQSQK